MSYGCYQSLANRSRLAVGDVAFGYQNTIVLNNELPPIIVIFAASVDLAIKRMTLEEGKSRFCTGGTTDEMVDQILHPVLGPVELLAPIPYNRHAIFGRNPLAPET